MSEFVGIIFGLPIFLWLTYVTPLLNEYVALQWQWLLLNPVILGALELVYLYGIFRLIRVILRRTK